MVSAANPQKLRKPFGVNAFLLDAPTVRLALVRAAGDALNRTDEAPEHQLAAMLAAKETPGQEVFDWSLRFHLRLRGLRAGARGGQGRGGRRRLRQVGDALEQLASGPGEAAVR